MSAILYRPGGLHDTLRTYDPPPLPLPLPLRTLTIKMIVTTTGHLPHLLQNRKFIPRAGSFPGIIVRGCCMRDLDYIPLGKFDDELIG
jgi:hypothetical protein